MRAVILYESVHGPSRRRYLTWHSSRAPGTRASAAAESGPKVAGGTVRSVGSGTSDPEISRCAQ